VTGDAVADSRRLYERRGFTLVGRVPNRSFSHDLVAETWGFNLLDPDDR
jgi:hypothetical protein